MKIFDTTKNVTTQIFSANVSTSASWNQLPERVSVFIKQPLSTVNIFFFLVFSQQQKENKPILVKCYSRDVLVACPPSTNDLDERVAWAVKFVSEDPAAIVTDSIAGRGG